MPGKRNYRRRGRKSKAVTWKALKKHELRNLEVKYADTLLSAAAIGALPTIDTGGYLRILNIPQGNEGDDRDGDVITMRSIFFTGQLSNTFGTPAPHVMYRLLIFTWKPQVSPTLAEVFADTSTNLICQTPLNPNAFRRIRVLRDIRGWITDTADHVARQFKIYLKVSTKLRFNAGSTTVVSNAPYFLLVSNNPGSSPPICNGCIRVRYTG